MSVCDRPIRGMSAVVMGAGPAHACFFATYEYCKHSLSQLTRHRHDHITHGQSPAIVDPNRPLFSSHKCGYLMRVAALT
ncbi:hypothetical protein HW555_014026 [Spodoptera exigua]|uniref:Uncharacterized protein n=1 Tax=Spodoptera exigua TaxID=7107 RepID=A0A835G3W8_SPOEX|nr:hypothetical protein HW555_014026 [Spodoptera exigua]KAH9644638.1 hypothetical protein HF086_011807 [Spodoptera exigua]